MNLTLAYNICLDTRNIINNNILIYIIGTYNKKMCNEILTQPQLTLIREALKDGFEIEQGFVKEDWENIFKTDYTKKDNLEKEYQRCTRLIPIYGSKRYRSLI